MQLTWMGTGAGAFQVLPSHGQQSFHSSLRWPRYTQDPSTQEAEAEAEDETHQEILAKTQTALVTCLLPYFTVA